MLSYHMNSLTDQEGNLVRVKKGEDLDGEESDGDYFETMPDGTIRLKAGKKKIDINKLSAEDLAKLGIDVKNMSRQEIARILKVCSINKWQSISFVETFHLSTMPS